MPVKLLPCVIGDWKAMFMENRANQLQIWLEPFVELRAPYL